MVFECFHMGADSRSPGYGPGSRACVGVHVNSRVCMCVFAVVLKYLGQRHAAHTHFSERRNFALSLSKQYPTRASWFPPPV